MDLLVRRRNIRGKVKDMTAMDKHVKNMQITVKNYEEAREEATKHLKDIEVLGGRDLDIAISYIEQMKRLSAFRHTQMDFYYLLRDSEREDAANG